MQLVQSLLDEGLGIDAGRSCLLIREHLGVADVHRLERQPPLGLAVETFPRVFATPEGSANTTSHFTSLPHVSFYVMVWVLLFCTFSGISVSLPERSCSGGYSAVIIPGQLPIGSSFSPPVCLI